MHAFLIADAAMLRDHEQMLPQMELAQVFFSILLQIIAQHIRTCLSSLIGHLREVARLEVHRVCDLLYRHVGQIAVIAVLLIMEGIFLEAEIRLDLLHDHGWI